MNVVLRLLLSLALAVAHAQAIDLSCTIQFGSFPFRISKTYSRKEFTTQVVHWGREIDPTKGEACKEGIESYHVQTNRCVLKKNETLEECQKQYQRKVTAAQQGS